MTVARVITSDSIESEWGKHQILVDKLPAKLYQTLTTLSQWKKRFRTHSTEVHIAQRKFFLKPGAQPKKQKQIFLQGDRREAMIEIAHNWLKTLKTEPCEGPWSSSAFPVRKKIYDWCGYKCKVYAHTIAWMSLLIAYDNVDLSQDGKEEDFSVMDLKEAFHQISLDEKRRPITGTSTPRGLQKWFAVIMVLKNSVAYCQITLETVSLTLV